MLTRSGEKSKDHHTFQSDAQHNSSPKRRKVVSTVEYVKTTAEVELVDKLIESQDYFDNICDELEAFKRQCKADGVNAYDEHFAKFLSLKKNFDSSIFQFGRLHVGVTIMHAEERDKFRKIVELQKVAIEEEITISSQYYRIKNIYKDIIKLMGQNKKKMSQNLKILKRDLAWTQAELVKAKSTAKPMCKCFK